MTENKGDLISRKALKEAISEATYNFEQIPIRVDKVQEIIDNAPTVAFPFEICGNTCQIERPQGTCKTCKYYYPYYKQFSSEPRGDGYCGISRMTPEGITHINCNDEFGCFDYQKGGKEE